MQLVHRYDVIKLLGRGAGGEVFLVEDSFSPGRPLALKTLHGDDEQLAGALRREFQVLAALRHPRLAQVFDFGLIPEGEPGGAATFLTREYLEGDSLRQVARELGFEEIISLVVGVCRALIPLHQSGLVHGDLKPDNVIVGPSRQVRLIDFGLVRTEGESTTWPTGTVPYLAPEVLRGQAADPRSDLYSLGALIFEMISGSPPFVGGTADVAVGHLESEVPPLVTRAGLTGVSPTALDGLERIVTRLLAKEPSERFPAVGEVEAALSSLVPSAIPKVGEEVVAVLPGLLGRETALSALEEALQRQRIRRKTGEPIAAVRGGPGSGKTTLMRELKWRCQLSGGQVVEAACESSPPDALWPLPELVRRLELQAGLERPETTNGQGATELAERAIEAIQAATARGTLLLIVEDIHLASPEVGAALRYFAHGASESPFLLVVSYVEGEGSRGADLKLGEHEVIDLRPLGRSEVERLTRSILGRHDDELAARVQEWTEGNPLFCMETLLTIRDRGGVSAGGLDDLGVPRRLEEFWTARAAEVSPVGQRLLAASALLGRPGARELVAKVAGVTDDAVSGDLEALIGRGLLTLWPSGAVGLAHAGLIEGAQRLMVGEALEEMHRRAADALVLSGGTSSEIAFHALQAGRSSRDGARDLAVVAARELLSSGAGREAARLLQLAIPDWEGPTAVGPKLLLAEARHSAGDYGPAAEILEGVLREVSGDAERSETLSLLGRVRAGRGEYDAAVEAWSEALELMKDPSSRARLQKDLGRMLLKRGDYPHAEEVTRAALEEVDEADPLRADLLCTLGMVLDYGGDAQGALERYGEALRLARACGARREESAVLTYEAIAHQRIGDYDQARQAYSQSLAIAQEIGEVGSMAVLHGNLGSLTYLAGEPMRALEHYRSALRLARRVGRESTAVTARANLGLLHLYMGEFERARHELEGALRDAVRLGMRQIAAQATAHLGELALRQGRLDRAVDLYRDARTGFEEVGQRREVVEVELDLALARIQRSTPSDLREVGSTLDRLRHTLLEGSLEALEPQLELADARLAEARGEEEQALSRFERAAKRAQEVGARDVEWQADADAAELLLRRGAPLAAKRRLQRAVELLEQVAATLPREQRKSFWQDPRRCHARRSLEQISTDGEDASLSRDRDRSTTEMLFRLLEINKRINSDHDLPTLFTRIMDSAVELTDAERGFLLLVNEAGELKMTTARDFDQGTPDDAHLQFSRSIAESVLIDGEPVITVNAMDDNRFNEYLSVHKLRLQSVLCIPIRARGRVIGVLYMENRLRRGGFSEPDQRILLAFADQVAIALETSRLMAELTRRTRELETAKAEIESLYDERGKLLSQRTAQLAAARRDLRQAMDQIKGRVGFHGIVGQSGPMLKVFAVLDRVREADVPVVIAGESGTGKEMVARAIHGSGPRSKKPFVAINCGAIPETLLESELFGHMRGSFTGADRDKKGLLQAAQGGTVFLDEIGDMPLKMQLDLLRVLQEKKVRPLGCERDLEIDVRVLAASNRPLRELIQRGSFREDLYYRLSVVEIVLPPLRDRADDVPLLVDHFLGQISVRFKAEKRGVTREAMRTLMSYPWPGNVRQLEHALMNAWVMCDGDTIDVVDLTLETVIHAPTSEQLVPSSLPATVQDRKDLEKQRILEALEQTGWNKSKAADVLGMPRRTLYRRLRAYGIQ